MYPDRTVLLENTAALRKGICHSRFIETLVFRHPIDQTRRILNYFLLFGRERVA